MNIRLMHKTSQIGRTKPRRLIGRLEKEYIKLFNSHFSKGGYNISFGGNTPALGLKASFETRMKMSLNNKGKNHPLFGKKFSEESKQKMSESHKGMKKSIKLSEEHKQKIGIANKNKKLTEEQKIKLSNIMKGKPWSEKRRTAQKARAK